MRRLFVLAALLPAAVFAQPVDRTLRINQYSTAVGGFTARDIAPPGGSAPGILYLNPTTGLPEYLTAGPGITLGSGTISASGGGGSVACASITGATTIGCNVLTAANAAAARTAIGAGTSSFDGAFGSLTGKPTTLAGYGITDAYPSTGNPSGFLTGITGSQVVVALGYTPGSGSGTVTSVTAGTGLSGGTITTSGTISLPNTGTAGTYSGVTTDAQGRVTAGTARSFNYTTRALNTCFQVSSTRDALVTYSVDIGTTSTLLNGQVGTVYLRIYSNSSCTTGTQEITRFVNGNTQTVGLSVTMVQNVTATLTGVVPAGAWVQQVTENTTGTPAFTARPGQETLL